MLIKKNDVIVCDSGLKLQYLGKEKDFLYLEFYDALMVVFEKEDIYIQEVYRLEKDNELIKVCQYSDDNYIFEDFPFDNKLISTYNTIINSQNSLSKR